MSDVHFFFGFLASLFVCLFYVLTWSVVCPRLVWCSLSLGDRSSSSTTLPAEVGTTGDSVGDESLDSTQPSPVLTPVYTSDAAREIVEEMRRQDAMAARRAVPRHKRRHITVSCSQPLVLEALPRVDMVGSIFRQ